MYRVHTSFCLEVPCQRQYFSTMSTDRTERDGTRRISNVCVRAMNVATRTGAERAADADAVGAGRLHEAGRLHGDADHHRPVRFQVQVRSARFTGLFPAKQAAPPTPTPRAVSGQPQSYYQLARPTHLDFALSFLGTALAPRAKA